MGLINESVEGETKRERIRGKRMRSKRGGGGFSPVYVGSLRFSFDVEGMKQS